MTEEISERIAYTRGKLEGMTGTVGASIKGIADCFDELSKTLGEIKSQLNNHQLDIEALSRSLTEVIDYLNSGVLMTKQEDPVETDASQDGVWVTPESEEIINSIPEEDSVIMEMENIAIENAPENV